MLGTYPVDLEPIPNANSSSNLQHDSPRTNEQLMNGCVTHDLQNICSLRPRRYHNLARSFNINHLYARWQLPHPTICPHCQALLFSGETSQLCCRHGRVQLEPIPAPVELQSLFAMENEEGRHFRQYVRAYNHVFAFTSMGVHIDETLASGANGIYTFRTQGNIYHSIGSLLPSATNRPRYMQMWIVDTDNEVNNRLLENQGLRRELLIKIQHILDQYNPFVHIFRQIGRRKDIPNCKLIIKQQPSNQRQYSLPTASQVAAVIVDNEGMDNLSGRDIIVESVAGSLINIQDVAGYYDPLQYPLLLAYGTYGWDINTRNIDGTRLTCLHYYAHMLQTYGKPDLMLTMTCNPNWIEIKEQLLSGQSPQDRPDLITRVFKAKFEEFKKDILDRGVLGKVISYSYVIEYQKRGLPHVHMLIIFATSDKLHTPDDFDSVVRAEIPSPRDEVQLYEAVIHHMIHGPCGSLNTKSPCMRDGICKKKFPKPFQPYTTQGNDSYPLYRRREGAPISINHDSQIMVDNGPKSFEDLMRVNEVLYTTFKEAAENRGLLQHDNYIHHCLQEACSMKMPSALRRLFVSILVFCQPTRVRQLWDKFHPQMSDDFGRSALSNNVFIINRLLLELRRLLHQYKKKLDDFDLPSISTEFMDDTPLPRIIEDELSIQILDEDLRSIQLLNPQQKMAFDIITQSVVHNESKLFFIDGPGGTGKTFLYRSILAHLRKQGKIVIAVATSGIAATLLPGGRTAHSRLKIPLMPTADTLCKIEKQSDLAELIRRASAIVWDEAPMANRYSFESVNKTFQDIMGNVLAFGGKTMVFGGDFRQVLPVVKRGSVREQIAASISRSTFWNRVNIIHLQQNMRSIRDIEFSQFLLRVGGGLQDTVKSDFIRLPETMIIPWEGEQSMKQLIDFVFPNMMENVNDADYMVGRAIITPKNVDVDIINDILISNFPGEEKEYISWDSVEDDNNNFFQEEFLNSLTPSGLPPHIITLKVGCPIMLLRNVAPELGLCNGTRLICRSLGRNFINVEIITGPHKDTRLRKNNPMVLVLSLVLQIVCVDVDFGFSSGEVTGLGQFMA
ncbi:hypothetical protein ZIOFF_024396 [Zingiber officinale]|uniref:ATP-dependent DNA helicase n=1 Tax=Zingiber officinale TaxID=94328 RepID=A0A8J5GSB4_ZINOF|nr:hypothetical protein ZIOFF_024396 [Zingiber officinale]